GGEGHLFRRWRQPPGSSFLFFWRVLLASGTEHAVLKALTIFSGNANRELAQAICRYVEVPLGCAEVTRFADGEIYVEIMENVRGVNCFVVQPTCSPVNDNLMELLVMIDALKRASAGSIIAVIPYFGYARQDRKSKPRTPISARLVADLLTAAGVSR